MSTYNDVLSQAQNLTQNLTPNEQKRLLEDLAKLMHQQATIKTQDNSQKVPKLDLDKWFGFLPHRVDPVDFQRKLRQEWDE